MCEPVAFGMYHVFLSVLVRGVNLEPGFGIDYIGADGTAVELLPPDNKQFFASFGTVQHFLALTFLKIGRPSRVKRIGFRDYFLETDDFCIGSVFQSGIGFFTFCRFDRGGKCPETISDQMPVFPGNPFSALFPVSAFCPLPQAFVYLKIHSAENFGRNNKSLAVDPAADDWIQL